MEFKTTTNTVCLNMIVKNESSIITRLFDSVLPIIDCYCICDTGSTDDTVQVITEYFNKKNITGKVFIEPFRNFSYNRNVALQECIGMSDFVLLLDADMILKVNNFTKDMLFGYDNFKIFQGTESFHYKNIRIVANNGKYKYEGVTHECIDPPPNSKTLIFNKNAIFINDIGDGGSKSDKFERDIILLTEGIVNYPTNTRYHFYLAQSLHDIGRYEEAIVYYKKRIVFGGWKVEVWYSYYRIGLCFAKLNKMADAVEYWLEGYEYYPQRLEGLHQLLQHYRKNSKHKLGNIIYQTTKQILEQNNDRQNYLFLNNDVYTYKLHYEYTIIACYLGIKNINSKSDGKQINAECKKQNRASEPSPSPSPSPEPFVESGPTFVGSNADGQGLTAAEWDLYSQQTMFGLQSAQQSQIQDSVNSTSLAIQNLQNEASAYAQDSETGRNTYSEDAASWRTQYSTDAQERWNKFDSSMDYKAATDSQKIKGEYDISLRKIMNAGNESVAKIQGEYSTANTALQGEYSLAGEKVRGAASRDVAQRNKEASMFGSFLGGFWA